MPDATISPQGRGIYHLNTKYPYPTAGVSYVQDVRYDVQITSSEDAYNLFKDDFPDIDYKEHFFAILINRQNRLLGVAHIASGGVSAVISDPKIIFQEAILANATGIVLMHNHPSGSLNPSNADIKLTKKCCEAAKMLDMALVDHIIISSSGYTSLADDGLI